MFTAHHDKGMSVWFGLDWIIDHMYPPWSPSMQLPLAGTDVCLYSDGTRVTEEYFHTLSDNTELVLVPRGHAWSGGGKDPPIANIKSNAQCGRFPKWHLCFQMSVTEDVKLLLCSGSLHDELIKAAKELLSVDDYADKNRKILSDLLLNLKDKSELEVRDDDEDWFKGTEATRPNTVGTQGLLIKRLQHEGRKFNIIRWIHYTLNWHIKKRPEVIMSGRVYHN